jgi:hypothetical protein
MQWLTITHLLQPVKREIWLPLEDAIELCVAFGGRRDAAAALSAFVRVPRFNKCIVRYIPYFPTDRSKCLPEWALVVAERRMLLFRGLLFAVTHTKEYNYELVREVFEEVARADWVDGARAMVYVVVRRFGMRLWHYSVISVAAEAGSVGFLQWAHEQYDRANDLDSCRLLHLTDHAESAKVQDPLVSAAERTVGFYANDNALKLTMMLGA